MQVARFPAIPGDLKWVGVSDVRITSTFKKVLLVLAVGAGVVVMLYVDAPTVTTIRQWSIDAGDWFPLPYFLAYVALTQFPIPRTVFTLTSGTLFGPVFGFLLAITATTVSAPLFLRTVRFPGRDWICMHLTNHHLLSLDHRLEQRDWLTVLSLRMIAGVSLSFLNYACGLSSMRIVPYIIATALDSAPNILTVVLLGDVLLAGFDVRFTMATGILFVLGLLGPLADAKLPIITGSLKR